MNLLFYTSILSLLPLFSADLLPTSLTQWYSRADILHRHEYKHSFCAPKLTLGNGNRIPFWKYGGDSIATQDSLRIVPSIRSRQGHIWNEYKLTAQDWEIDVAFRVSGRLRQGADGMAIWLTEEQMGNGPVFGSSEVWNGIGIILDSFDNDALKDNPKIQLVVNDGTRRYDHQLDGKSDELASCIKDYRNQPYVVRLKIIKADDVLQVWVHSGYSMNPGNADYDLCIQAPMTSFTLPEAYLGVTAATGGLSDDHDVMCFTLHSLTEREVGPNSEVNQNANSEEDTIRKRVSDLYEEYDKEFSERRDQFKLKHPDTSDQYEMEDFEDSVESKLKLLLDRQETLLLETLSTKMHVQTVNVATGGSDTDQLLKTVSREIKNLEHRLNDVKLGSPIASESQASLHDMNRQIRSLQDSFDNLKNNMDRTLTQLAVGISELGQRPVSSNQPVNALQCSGCVGFWSMLLLVTSQLLVFSCFIGCIKLKEHRSKKYF